jgi:hypothetical protein
MIETQLTLDDIIQIIMQVGVAHGGKFWGDVNRCYTPSRRFERHYMDDSRILRDVFSRWVNKTGADSAFAPVR